MSNLPDDWGMYRRKCTECGYHYHLSGTEECKCPPETFPCEHPACDEKVEDEDDLQMLAGGENWCASCVDNHATTCEVCEEIFPREEIKVTWSNAHCEYCDDECRKNKTHHHAVMEMKVDDYERERSELIWALQGMIDALSSDFDDLLIAKMKAQALIKKTKGGE